MGKKIKEILILAGFIFVMQTPNVLYAQNFGSINEKPAVPGIYFGIGFGVNDYGFGLNAEVPVTDKVSINGNFGLGGWGFKYGGSINLYTVDVMRRSEFSLGYSRASGLKDFETTLWTEPGVIPQTVNLNLNSIQTINVSYTYNIKIGRNSKIGFSGGYAISLTQDPYHVNSAIVLAEDSKTLLRVMQPGGLIIGVRFLIGVI